MVAVARNGERVQTLEVSEINAARTSRMCPLQGQE